MKLLDKINDPADLKALSGGEVGLLAGELREVILQTVARCGGHLGSNLGAVELTLALLRSFDLPQDKIIWDVGHQTYAYKLLTGRRNNFEKLRQFNGCCGFPVRGESQFDCYGAGHAGVAVSAALGMCAAQTDGDTGKVVAVVGDGAIGSGVALEGLNQVRDHGRNLIIVLNDNKMAISPNVGGIARCLNRIMVSRRYRWSKNCAKALINLLPKSERIYHAVSRLEDGAKNLLLPGGPFQELGIRYLGPINGHNIADMERTFAAVQRDDRPVLIHIVTEKGRGYVPAEAAPERFHGIGKFNIADGRLLKAPQPGFSAAFGKAACELAQNNCDLAAVVAAMTGGVGLDEFAREYPERFYDAGMAESHAVSFSSGLAAEGKTVLCAIYATFMQRSLDNIFHDVALMALSVIFVLDRAGLVDDGPTHHGIYDLGFLLGIPNLTVMQPACEAEIKPMLETAIQRKHPAVIRYPRGCSNADSRHDIPEIPVVYGRSAVWRRGTDLVIYAAGAEAVRALEIADLLAEKYDLRAGVVNVRFLKPFDSEALRNDLMRTNVFTLEDHVAATGLGAVASGIAAAIKEPHYPLKTFGLPADEFVPFGAVNDLRKALALDSEALADKIAGIVRSGK